MEDTIPNNEGDLNTSQSLSKTGIFYIIAGALQILTSFIFFYWWGNGPEYMGPLTLALVLTGSSLGLIFLGARWQINPNINLYILALSVLTIICLTASISLVANDTIAMDAASDREDSSPSETASIIILFFVGPVLMFHMVNCVVLLITHRALRSEENKKRRISRLALSLIIIPILIYVVSEPTLSITSQFRQIILLANICLVPSGIISLVIVFFQTRKT